MLDGLPAWNLRRKSTNGRGSERSLRATAHHARHFNAGETTMAVSRSARSGCEPNAWLERQKPVSSGSQAPEGASYPGWPSWSRASS